MKKGKLIGKGMTAEVYEWGQDKVLKLYYNWFTHDRIQHDAEIAYLVSGAGIPSPAPFDIIYEDGREGIIFQRIYGKSMFRHVEAEPWKICCFARQMAALHFRIHKYYADKLPSQKEKFAVAIANSSEMHGSKKKRILEYLEKLPGGVSVCHGDLHFDNVIISNNNPIAIDWSKAYTGNPLGDVARTCLTIDSPTMPIGKSGAMVLPYIFGKSMAFWAYLNEYTRLAKVRPEEIYAWILPVAAARLEENIPGEKKWLLDTVNSFLYILQ